MAAVVVGSGDDDGGGDDGDGGNVGNVGNGSKLASYLVGLCALNFLATSAKALSSGRASSSVSGFDWGGHDEAG